MASFFNYKQTLLGVQHGLMMFEKLQKLGEFSL